MERDQRRCAVSPAMSGAAFRCWRCRRRRAHFSSLAAAAATPVCGFRWPRAQKESRLQRSISMKRRSPWRGKHLPAPARRGSVQVFHGDALDYATRLSRWRFASRISSRRSPTPSLRAIVPRLVSGGWLVIDNVTSPRYPEGVAGTRAQRSTRRLRALAVSKGRSHLPENLTLVAQTKEGKSAFCFRIR